MKCPEYKGKMTRFKKTTNGRLHDGNICCECKFFIGKKWAKQGGGWVGYFKEIEGKIRVKKSDIEGC